jgi:hypothetical protein
MAPDNRLIALNFLTATCDIRRSRNIPSSCIRSVGSSAAIASLLVRAHTKKRFREDPEPTMGRVTCATFEKCLHNEINDLHFLTTLASIKKGSEVAFFINFQ